MKVYNKFAEMVQYVLKQQCYSEDVQNTSYDDIAADDSFPPELRNFMTSAGLVWDFLQDADVEEAKEPPVLQSTGFVATPTDMDEVRDMLAGIPQEFRGTASIAVQMTINYINSKS